MKKLTLLILVLAMTFSVCACNKTDASEKGVTVASSPDYVEIINDLIAKHRDVYLENPSVAYSGEEKEYTPDLTFMEPEKMALLSNNELEVLREDYNDFKAYMYMEVYKSLGEMFPDAPAFLIRAPGYVNSGLPMHYQFLEADKCADATEEELQEYLDGTVFPIINNRPSRVEEPKKDFGDVFVVTAFLYITYYDSETGTAVELSLYDGENMAREIFNNNASDETYAFLEEHLGKEFVDSLREKAEKAKQSALLG